MRYFIGSKFLGLARVVAKVRHSLRWGFGFGTISHLEKQIILYVGDRDKNVPVREKDILYFCAPVNNFPIISVIRTKLAIERLERLDLITIQREAKDR